MLEVFIEYRYGYIVKSGFEKFSPDAILVENPNKLSIEDCLLVGTNFQIKVWKAISEIPAGEIRTYGELVRICGGSPQSVGTACGRNKIPYIIPCHRVVGKTNKLAYSAGKGAETKRELLRSEGVII